MNREDDLHLIHHALLSGDPTAPRRLDTACTRPLRRILKRRYAVLPEEALTDAVTDTLLAFILHPERYDPRRGTILNYLVQVGSHKILDQLRRLRRRREVYVGGTVELSLVEVKHYPEEIARLEPFSDPDALPAEMETLLNEILPDPRDRRVWDLLCQGRTAPSDYAEVLGITHLPPEMQRTAVKRHRDRVYQRVRRRRAEFRRLL